MAQADSNNSIPVPAVSTRRRFISQAAGVAAGGTVLALATIPPALAAAAPVVATLDAAMASPALRAADLARVEQIVDLLRTCYVREGWKIDDAAAEHALEYSRQYAKDGSDPDEGREATIDFLCSHGQSLDWAFGGDVGGMICRGAKHSERANSIIAAVPANDPVFALIETHRAAAAALTITLRAVDGHDNDDAIAVDSAHQAELSALTDLIEAVPTTIPGVIANMRYIADHVVAGSMGRLGDGDINPLLLNLAEALESLAVAS
jgi:hypothetical protein